MQGLCGTQQGHNRVTRQVYNSEELVELYETDPDDELRSVSYSSSSSDSDDASVQLSVPENNEIQRHKYPEFNPRIDMEDPIFKVGLSFASSEEFKAAVKQHAIKWGKKVKVVKSEKWRIRYKCEDEHCDWEIYASKLQEEETLIVKTFRGIHKCSRSLHVSQADYKWLAEKYSARIRSNPTWPTKSLKETMELENVIKLSYGKVYRAKRLAMSMITGSEEQQYFMLRSYCEELRRSNPGTTCGIQSYLMGEKCIFKRLYVCFGALKRGFLEGCRKFIGLDGCHLKTACGGVLLTAIGIDPNNKMYPLAFGVVEKERYDSWHWFIELMKDDLEMHNSHGCTIMSDRQKGLLEAVANLLPNAQHRFCMVHLYNNFKKKYKGLAFKRLVWRAATATRRHDFDSAMEEIKKLDMSAYTWWMTAGPVHWARSYFDPSSKCDLLTNNFCESFNKVILGPRDKPIITMIESIRIGLMERIHEKREEMGKNERVICTKILGILEVSKTNSASWIARWNGGDKFEVSGMYGERRIVDGTKKSCSCSAWDLTGIPCCHAVASLHVLNEDPEKYIDSCYKTGKFMDVYNNLMNPVNAQEEWPKTSSSLPLSPPIVERRSGRRKKSRTKQPEEEPQGSKLIRRNTTVKCGLCGQRGHNRRNCSNSRLPISTAELNEGAPPSSSFARLSGKLPVRRMGSTMLPNVDD